MIKEIKFDKYQFIELIAYAHFSLWDSKTIIVSEDAKFIKKGIKILCGDSREKEYFVYSKDMIHHKDRKNTWWLMVKNVKKGEEIMGICGDHLLFILDNVESYIIDIVRATCRGENNRYIIIEDEQ